MNICNHTYAARYRNRPLSMGQQCPYPQLYDRVRSTGAWPPEADAAQFLPLDERGTCIFHSRELAWKRQNDFTGKFCQLVRLLDEHDVQRYYDFAEFVFLGSDLITKSGAGQYLLRLSDMTFRKQAYFTGASFIDSFALERVEFQDGASFDQAIFYHDLAFEKSRVRGLDFTEAQFNGGVSFKEVEFQSFTFFAKATLKAAGRGTVILFKDSRFDGLADFGATDFTLGDESAVCFQNVQFLEFADFRNAHFNCQVDFSDVSFADTTEFIDTSFDMIRSTARYRGTAVEFNRIQLTTEAVLSFISTDPHHKMFNHDVQMSFKEDPSGVIRFENVNFNLFTPGSKERLTQLAKLGRVEIGSGCIKYRFQTAVQTISVSEGNTALVLELCQTFTNYFTASNGLNLGFEIVERDKTKVSFFYFTDEDISDEVFRDRLAQTNQSLWNLLSINSEEQVLALEESSGAALAKGRESGLINAVDAISAMVGTFFRVSARIALGKWTESDTSALLNAIPLNGENARNRSAGLHQLLEDRYTRGRLFGLSGELNKRLFLEGKVAALDQTVHLLAGKGDKYVMGDNYEVTGNQVGVFSVETRGESNPPEKIKILFLASNPTDISPLRLGEQVRQIDEKISFGSRSEAFELIQYHAVRITDLQRVLLKHEPHIVHFCGHGSATEEIVFQDEQEAGRAVGKAALTTLFRILRDNVRVVFLNACFSMAQAEALQETVDYTIGMHKEVGDKVAISFAGAFYQALAFDRTVMEAFQLAKTELDLVRLPGCDTPKIFVNPEADVKKCFISQKPRRTPGPAAI